MRRTSSTPKAVDGKVAKDIRRTTRRHFSAADEIRIVVEDIRGR